LTTRRRNAVALLIGALLIAAALVFVARSRPRSTQLTSCLQATPSQALAVLWVRVPSLRASPLMRLIPSDDDPGALPTALRRTCGFDPVDRLREIVLWMPDSGGDDFGLAALGDLPASEMMRCARAAIVARKGVVTTSSSAGFTLIADQTLGTGSASIAMRDRDLVLLGRGGPLARMIAVVSGQEQSAATQGDHARMRQQMGVDSADVVLTAVIGAALRDQIRAAAGNDPTPLASVLALSAVVQLGLQARLRVLFWCDSPLACRQLSDLVQARRDEVRGSVSLRLAGIASLLETANSQALGNQMLLSAEAPADQIVTVVQRIWRWQEALGNGSQPQPPALQGPKVILPEPNEVLRAKQADGGS
jgi:hypothetical protein